jgi:hypothetical protein
MFLYRRHLDGCRVNQRLRAALRCKIDPDKEWTGFEEQQAAGENGTWSRDGWELFM